MNLDALRRKAELGDTFAQAIVGICCLDGIDERVNYGEAFRFLSAAAEKGMPRAIVSLARMYAEGLGIQKDAAKAVELYERAAGSGEFLAQIALGRIYSQGLGVPINVATALKWYAAAIAQGDRVAENEIIEEARAYLDANSR